MIKKCILNINMFNMEMKIKIIMNFYYFLVRMVVIKINYY